MRGENELVLLPRQVHRVDVYVATVDENVL